MMVVRNAVNERGEGKGREGTVGEKMNASSVIEGTSRGCTSRSW